MSDHDFPCPVCNVSESADYLCVKCGHCTKHYCKCPSAPSAPRELSDDQTYDTLCPTCGKPLDGHTHELIVESKFDEHLRVRRQIDAQEALDAANAFIDEHFRKTEARRVTCSIPVQDTDTDVVLVEYIQQSRDHITALQSRLEADIACDRAYIEGCRLGYRLGLYEDREGRDAAIEARSKNIREAARGV